MPSVFSRRTVASMTFATAIIVMSFASAGAANANPVAPPTTTSTSASFLVPLDAPHAAEPFEVSANFKNPFGSTNPGLFSVTVGCDDGSKYLAEVKEFSYEINGVVGAWALFAGLALPAAERGHMCTISTTAPANRSLVMGQPWIGTPDSSFPRAAYFYGDVLCRSSTGGL